ncbi:MAG: NFACT family protein [Oscillospiraceae bacterium]
MPLDAVYISELVTQFADILPGMKIDRVRQPERDTVLLSLRGGGQSRTLLINFGSGNARVCFTEDTFENPPQPPMFCMLLRKHLIGARITGVSQPERERMLRFSLLCYDEMGVPVEKSMAVELLGRNANLVLIDGEGRIIDAARRVDAEMSPLRQLLPGLIYREPPKPEPGRFSGLSPLIRREMEFRGLPDSLDSLAGLERAPYMLLENGEPKDFTFLPILQYGPAVESVQYPGWSELLEAFYARRDRAEHQKNRAKSMAKLVRNAKGRTERKLSLRIAELGATEDRELDKRRGDLITANIWRMQPGQEELVTEDFYEDGAPSVTIPLDRRKTPQQNAAVYYKQYTKKKAAREHLTGLIEENTAELEYLGSIAEEIERAQTQAELEDIRRELEAAGYVRAPKNAGKKVKKPKPVPPLTFRTTAGLAVYVGRNNVQNDELTFKLARRTDLWLHVQKLHGAHVILCCQDAEPDAQSVYEAACLAAYYSEGKQAGRVAVDAAPVRFVKKPRGARPGKVIYTDQRTILAEPRHTI